VSSVALAYMLGAVGLLVWVIVVAVLWRDEPAPLRPVVHPSVPGATICLFFVEVTAAGMVVDGLLDIEGAALGIPTTWTLEPPRNEVIGAATLSLLERWSDDGMPVTLDLSRLDAPRPSVALSRDASLVRLPVLALSPRPGDDRVGRR
jgi:hypothetical protein